MCEKKPQAVYIVTPPAGFTCTAVSFYVLVLWLGKKTNGFLDVLNQISLLDLFVLNCLLH